MQNKFWAIPLFIFIINNTIRSQNLLPNGDFSEQQTCIEFSQKCAPMGWRLTSADPPTYYREFEGNDSTANKAWTAFIALSLTEKQYREYLQAPLLCPLIKGEKYLFSITVKPERFAIKEFGVKFTDTSTITGVNRLIVNKPDFVFFNPNYLHKKKNEWQTLTYEYTANGTEHYILIGNFKPDEDTQYKPIKALKFSMKIAYYVGNIGLSPAKKIQVCDYSSLLKRLRNDRYRHSLFSLQFFQDSLSREVIKPKKKKSVVAAQARADSVSITQTVPTIYFDFDKYTLREKSIEDLTAITSHLLKYQKINVSIIGHTDSIGSYKYNNELSIKRANAVKDFLVKEGVNAQRLTIVGMGETQPILNNITEIERQTNRRAKLILIYQ